MTQRDTAPPLESISDGLSRVRSRSKPVRDRVRARFDVDTRSLAAARIALGLVVLIDLINRAGYIEVFYSDAGAYPLSAYEVTYSRYTGLSVHALSGDVWFQQLLFVVAGLFAVAFILGYRTRLVGLISVGLLLSLQARNPAVLNGGDRLFRVLFVVALVTPLGERWSIDALRRGSARKSVASFGTAALLVQPLVVFLSNAVEKHAGDTWYAGEAVGIAMANDVMTVLLGDVIAQYPPVTTVLTYAWVTLLAGCVVFLLVPVGWVRAATTFVYIGAFAGMVTSMAVGLFPFLLVASVLPYLPGVFWDALERRVAALSWRPSPSALGPFGRAPVERRLLQNGRAAGYDRAVSYVTAYAKSLLTIVGFCVLVWILLFSATEVSGQEVPDELDYEHLDQQKWGLYAPNPSTTYDWYVPSAELANGTEVHAVDGGSITFERPAEASEEYETFRHRKFMQAVQRSGPDGSIAEGYADWACRQAAERYDTTVDHVTLYRLIQASPVDGEFEDDPRRRIVTEYECPAA